MIQSRSLEDVLCETQSRLTRLRGEEQTADYRTVAGWHLFAGLEQRRAGEDYYHNSSKRGGEQAHPYIIFQYTLSGLGAIEREGKYFQVPPGSAFITRVPSEESYYLPEHSPGWSFFWLTMVHPYLVSRLGPWVQAAGPVLHIPPETRLYARSVSLWEEQHNGLALDAIAREQSLFDWMFELERFCHALVYPQAERDQWLNAVRRLVAEHLTRSWDVADLAREKGMSRSHFSHCFKSATGLSPATWVQQIRLEEVARRLTQTDDKLDRIARDVGLGDANQLCKVFRRRFHLSPGEFRRQQRFR